MKTHRLIVLTIICAWCHVLAAFCQAPMVRDVFPLAVGNAWTYQYQAQVIQTIDLIDTYNGRATCSIVDMQAARDSVRWFFKEARDIIHTGATYFGGTYRTERVVDTTAFEVIEYLSGAHRLVRPGSFMSCRFSLVPFTVDFSDSLGFFRYALMDTGSVLTLREHYLYAHPFYYCTFSFASEQGILKENSFSTADIFGLLSVNHQLLTSVITSVESRTRSNNMVLVSPAFPNPFNPTTSIRFSLNETKMVQLRVHDVLGRVVATLIDHELHPGSHVATWNATGIANGTYLVRLKLDAEVRTQKVVLLK